MEVKRGNDMDYVFLFGDSRTIYTDSMVRAALRGEEKWFLIALMDGKPAGYLCAVEENPAVKILYAYTREPLRGQGVFHALMSEMLRSTRLPIRLNIAQENPYCAAVESVCRTLGFEEHSSFILYHAKADKLSVWDDFMEEKGNSLLKLLGRWGFSAVSLAESPEEILKQFYDSGMNGFQNQLEVRSFFDNEYKFLNRELTFAAVKDGKLAAYCLASSVDGVNVVYEQFSAAEKYLGSGVILLPFAKSMEVFRKLGAKKAYFAISETNRRSKLFYEKVLERMIVSKSKSTNYLLSRY